MLFYVEDEMMITLTRSLLQVFLDKNKRDLVVACRLPYEYGSLFIIPSRTSLLIIIKNFSFFGAKNKKTNLIFFLHDWVDMMMNFEVFVEPFFFSPGGGEMKILWNYVGVHPLT